MSSKYVFIKNRGEEYFKVMKKVKGIYYLVEEGHYGLKMILEFEDTEYLYFDSCKFLLKKNEKSNLITSKWTKLEYPELEKDDVYIKEIKEDEAIAYFIRFSNNDILHIYGYIDGLENWFLDFEIVSPKNENYNEIITHMNETWVNTIM